MSIDREQAISFAYGNLKIDKPDTKRETVERAYDKLHLVTRQPAVRQTAPHFTHSEAAAIAKILGPCKHVYPDPEPVMGVAFCAHCGDIYGD